MPTPLDDLRQLVDGTRPAPPIATLIGFTLTAVSPGEAVIELPAGPQERLVARASSTCMMLHGEQAHGR